MGTSLTARAHQWVVSVQHIHENHHSEWMAYPVNANLFLSIPLLPFMNSSYNIYSCTCFTFYAFFASPPFNNSPTYFCASFVFCIFHLMLCYCFVVTLHSYMRNQVGHIIIPRYNARDELQHSHGGMSINPLVTVYHHCQAHVVCASIKCYF